MLHNTLFSLNMTTNYINLTHTISCYIDLYYHMIFYYTLPGWPDATAGWSREGLSYKGLQAEYGPTYIYIYIYICMYVCIYVCVYIYIYIYIYTDIYLSIYLSIYLFISLPRYNSALLQGGTLVRRNAAAVLYPGRSAWKRDPGDDGHC